MKAMRPSRRLLGTLDVRPSASPAHVLHHSLILDVGPYGGGPTDDGGGANVRRRGRRNWFCGGVLVVDGLVACVGRRCRVQTYVHPLDKIHIFIGDALSAFRQFFRLTNSTVLWYLFFSLTMQSSNCSCFCKVWEWINMCNGTFCISSSECLPGSLPEPGVLLTVPISWNQVNRMLQQECRKNNHIHFATNLMGAYTSTLSKKIRHVSWSWYTNSLWLPGPHHGVCLAGKGQGNGRRSPSMSPLLFANFEFGDRARWVAPGLLWWPWPPPPALLLSCSLCSKRSWRRV